MTDEMPEQKADQDHVEHQLAAERRGWVFSFPGAAGGRPAEGHSIFAAQATRRRPVACASVACLRGGERRVSGVSGRHGW